MKIRLGELKKIIREEVGGGRRRLVIVDVQPEHEGHIGFDVAEMLKFAGGYSRVLVLWNGPTVGFSDEGDLRSYYVEKMVEAGLDDEDVEDLLRRMKFFDKGYGFFRGLMDSDLCFPRRAVVKIVKWMIDNDVRDISDLTADDVDSIGVAELLVDDLEDYGFYIPDLKDVLGDWDGSDMVGGQKNECMAEVDILASAMGIGLNKVSKFIY